MREVWTVTFLLVYTHMVEFSLKTNKTFEYFISISVPKAKGEETITKAFMQSKYI